MKMTVAVAVATTVITAAFMAAMGGVVYRVGDSVGWTNIGHVDYKTWASTKIFQVGDTIVFEYNKDFQNVAKVTYTDFLACNGSAPYATYTSGNDSFPIQFPGHYYFICTLPGHCEAGQKVDIRVPLAGNVAASPSSGPSAAPLQPLPFPYPPPPFPAASPSKSHPSHSPAPATLPAEPPSSTPAYPSPEIAPSPPKNGDSQPVKSFKLWTTIMAVSFYLIAFSC